MGKWSTSDMPSQAGRTAVVTGANRGLGYEIASALAAAGATVVLACRDRARGEQAARQIQAGAPLARVEVMAYDQGEQKAIRSFAAQCKARHPRIDLLVNNASAILVPRGLTADGFETHMGVNHLGSFALTGSLLDALAPDARVVGTASLAHKMCKGFDVEDLQFRNGAYTEMEAYGRSKLATLLFTMELDRRLRARGSKIRAVAAHPGWSNTNPDRGGFFMRAANALFAQPPARGAEPALYAATMADVQGGEYFGPAGMGEMGGAAARVKARPEAYDAALAAKLWEKSEALTGLRYP